MDLNGRILADHVIIRNGAYPIGRYDFLAHLGHYLVHRLVACLFEFQTAHQPAADAGDLCLIEGKILLLCHLYGNGDEIRKE